MDRSTSARLFACALLVPALAYTLFVVAYPLVDTIQLSFTNASLKPTTEYVGIRNYEKLFGGHFISIITRTFYWMFLSVALKMLIGLLGAVLLNAAVPGKGLFRILTMPPWIVPVAIGVFTWGWMYNGQFGMISGVLQRLDLIDQPFEFLATRSSAFYSTVVTDVWVGTPFVTLFLLAAVQAIPKDLYEAAWVDGASRWYRFRRITLPMIVPAVATMSVLCVIWSFNSFEIIWILTEGGPRDGTTTMIIDTYKTAFSRYRMGEGAARAVTICVFLSLFSFVYLKLLNRIARSEKGAA